MRRSAGLYVTLLSLAAAVVLGVSGAQLRIDHWDELLIFAFLISLSGRFMVRGLSTGGLDWEAAIVMVTFVIAGPAVAMWATAIGLLADNLIRSGRLSSLLFNIAAQTVTLWGAFQVFALLGGRWGGAFDRPLPAAVMIGTMMLMNASMVGGYLHLTGNMRFKQALGAMLDASSVRSYLIVSVMGLFVGYSYVKSGWQMAILAAAFAWLLQTIIGHYFEAISEARRKAQQMEVVLNATHSAIIMKNDKGRIQVANQRVQSLFGVSPAEILGRDDTEVTALPRTDAPSGNGVDQEIIEQVFEQTFGTFRYIHWYRGAVHDSEGALQGHVEVFTDVTELKEAEQRVRRSYDAMTRALTAAIDARDSYTLGHSERVSAYAVTLARHMGLPARDVERIRYSGLLHDIGKLGVDDTVLRKTGPLTPAERAMMMQHPVIGAEVLQKANVLTDLLPGVRWHHEWYGGGGYPDGLRGEAIPLDARIMAVADALDAMTSDRPYRPALGPEEALRRLREGSPAQFDPQVVAALLAAIEDGELALGEIPAETEAVAEQTADGVIRPVHGKELLVLAQLSREDYSALSLDAMLQRYLTTFAESIGQNVYLVSLVDHATDQLQLKASSGLLDRDLNPDWDQRQAADAVRKGGPLVVNDIRRSQYQPASVMAKAVAAFPLVSEDGVEGTLVVESAAPWFFDQDAVYLFEALAQRLCSAVKLVRYHEQLVFAAWHDGLTGVYNHSYFYERLTEAVNRAAEQGRTVSVVLLDLNELKALNDTYGHLAGDAALRQYGRVLQAQVRNGDVVARYGGDEFAIIMPDLDRAGALREVNRLMERLGGQFDYNGSELPLPTAAWGLASYPQDGDRSAELIMVADQVMYRGKERKAEHSCQVGMSAD